MTRCNDITVSRERERHACHRLHRHLRACVRRCNGCGHRRHATAECRAVCFQCRAGRCTDYRGQPLTKPTTRGARAAHRSGTNKTMANTLVAAAVIAGTIAGSAQAAPTAPTMTERDLFVSICAPRMSARLAKQPELICG